MVTLPLERMASRVAASLCYATGLGPEMVVNSQVPFDTSWVKDILQSCRYFDNSGQVLCSAHIALCVVWVDGLGHQVGDLLAP